jgi:acyl-CoA dehydrogenase
MPNYFFSPAPYPDLARGDEPRHDEFLFRQGSARGLGQIRFHDYRAVFARYARVSNVEAFAGQAAVLAEALLGAPLSAEQDQDIDFLMALGELFTLVVYGQLILENAAIYRIDDDTVDQIFDFMVRDFSKFALELYGKRSSTPAQQSFCLRMLRKPVVDDARYARVWRDSVYALNEAYEMNT